MHRRWPTYTILHENITAGINIEGNGTPALSPFTRWSDAQVEHFHPLAFIQMSGPERRILQVHSTDLHILTVWDIHQPRAHFVHVGTLGIEGTAQQNAFPVAQAIANDSAFPRNGKSIEFIGIYQRGKILQRLPFHARHHDREIAYIVASFQASSSSRCRWVWLEEQAPLW